MSVRPVRVTIPSCTVTATDGESARKVSAITSASASRRMSASGRAKTRSTSARLMIPIRSPVSLITGSLLTRRSRMRRAASESSAPGPMVTGGMVISSAAVTPSAFSRSPKRNRSDSVPGPVSRSACLFSMSASDTTPMTRPSPSTTGRALARDLRIFTTISLNDAVGPTATTCVVITSLTVLPIAIHPSGCANHRVGCTQHAVPGGRSATGERPCDAGRTPVPLGTSVAIARIGTSAPWANRGSPQGPDGPV